MNEVLEKGRTFFEIIQKAIYVIIIFNLKQGSSSNTLPPEKFQDRTFH